MTGSPGGDDGAVTGAVGLDVAFAEPVLFDAVTLTFRTAPTSVFVTTYVDPVAPAIAAHVEPVVMQRDHWYVYEIGGVPAHAPGAAVNVWPDCAVPLIVGTLKFTGGWFGAPAA